jgi:hypothetical protein
MADQYDFFRKLGDELFTKRSNLLNLWQTIADNFYPERADFTTERIIGEEFGDHLMSSYPILARRDLGNSFGAMLRPSSKNWFKIITDRQDKMGIEAKGMLEWMTGLQKRAMYDPDAMFVRATSEGDHDFAAFGQCVIQCQMNMNNMSLLYRTWHLRDVAWEEDEIGRVGTIFRKWKAKANTLVRTFGEDRLHKRVTECLKKNKPFEEFEIWHIIVPTDLYEYVTKQEKKYKTPFVSIYYDKKNLHEIECVGSWTKQYVIPRWQTVSGSQYAYSPATITALPDARLIQAMTSVILEAGEKSVDPPMVATQNMIRSDISIYAGGVTWVDAEYDERLGDVLRPLSNDYRGIPLGIELSDRTQMMIKECFYLSKLSLPPPEAGMTAYEVGKRVQEYIRQALPLFEPMEMEYNGAVCEETFDILLRNFAFGNPSDFPQELRGAEVHFQFESPLKEAADREKGQRWLEAKEMLANAADIDPSAVHMIDASVALRDVLEGIGVPVKWTRSEAQIKEINEEMQQAQQAQEMMAQMESAAKISKDFGQAQKGAAGMPPQTDMAAAA